MNKLFIISLFFIFNFSLFARELEVINREYRQTEEREFAQNIMYCYVEDRTSGVILTRSFRRNNNEFIQDIRRDRIMGQIRVELLENNNMRVQYWQVGEEIFSEIKPRPVFSFDQDMLGLSEIAQNNPQFSMLNAISCYIGSSIFYYEHNQPGHFLLSTHVQALFYPAGLANWWNDYLKQFRGWTKIITKHIQRFQLYVLNEETLNHPANSYPDLITGDLEMDVYKIAPSGFMHLKFGPRFDGKIVVVGGMFNYCMTNNLISISRAFIDSGRSELLVEFPLYYIYAQTLGVTPELSVIHNPLVYRLSDLYEENRSEVYRLMQQMKILIEFNSKYQIEVVVPGEEGQTNKPKLHLSLDIN